MKSSTFSARKRGVASRFGQVDAPQGCLSTDCANAQSFADDRPNQTQQPHLPRKNTSNASNRSIEKLRQKRLRRNAKKKTEIRSLTRTERRKLFSSKDSRKYNEELKEKLRKVQEEHKKEKRLSAFCWTQWKEERQATLRLYREPKSINRQNLKKVKEHCVLGKGAFGTCEKLKYRGIDVAVKTYGEHVRAAAVSNEASIISKFDHKALPLLFGVCLEKKPYLLVTQFHGTDGDCLTLNKAATNALIKAKYWTSIFKKTAEALEYVHLRGFLHNDIKGDNVLLTNSTSLVGSCPGNLHPVLIDFGKSCKTCNAKKYSLSYEEQQKYRRHHWHIAPELISGLYSQSFASDVYSLGVLMLHTCRKLPFPNVTVSSVARECTTDSPNDRPHLRDVIKKLFASQY